MPTKSRNTQTLLAVFWVYAVVGAGAVFGAGIFGLAFYARKGGTGWGMVGLACFFGSAVLAGFVIVSSRLLLDILKTVLAIERNTRGVGTAPSGRGTDERVVPLLERIEENTALSERDRQLRSEDRARAELLERLDRARQANDYAAAIEAAITFRQRFPERIDQVSEETVAELRARQRDRHFEALRAQLSQAMEVRDWSATVEPVEALRRDFADDSRTGPLLAELQSRRRREEEGAISEAAEGLEELARERQWPEVFQKLDELGASFGADDLVQELRRRMERLRDESAVAEKHELVARIKEDMQGGRFTRALAAAKEFLALYPEGPEAARLWENLPVLEARARDQERTAEFANIRKAVTENRFADAYELAEKLIAKYPRSREAQALSREIHTLKQKAENS